MPSPEVPRMLAAISPASGSVAVGAYSGPIALFDGKGAALVASARSEFAAASLAALAS